MKSVQLNEYLDQPHAQVFWVESVVHRAIYSRYYHAPGIHLGTILRFLLHNQRLFAQAALRTA